jgi:hypothetical protein
VIVLKELLLMLGVEVTVFNVGVEEAPTTVRVVKEGRICQILEV